METRDKIGDLALMITEDLLGPILDDIQDRNLRSRLVKVYTAAQQIIMMVEEDELNDEPSDATDPKAKRSWPGDDNSQKGMKLVPGGNK